MLCVLYNFKCAFEERKYLRLHRLLCERNIYNVVARLIMKFSFPSLVVIRDKEFSTFVLSKYQFMTNVIVLFGEKYNKAINGVHSVSKDRPR